MVAVEEWRISSEDEAWVFFERVLADDSQAVSATLKLDGWRPEFLYFPDEEIGHSVSPATAAAVSSFHKSLAQAYALIAYGQPNRNLLRSDDRRKLEIRLVVTNGSNGYEFVDESINEILAEMVSNMTGEQTALVLGFFVLMYFGGTAFKHWIDARQKDRSETRESDTRKALSDEETRRLELVTEALSQRPDLKQIAQVSEDAKEAAVRPVTMLGRARVLGAEITPEEARKLLARPRQSGTGVRLDGEFEVVEIGIENPEGYVGRLRRIEDDLSFDVEINYADLPQEDIDTLFVGVKDKVLVRAVVNAWLVSERISRAVVVRADPVAESD